MSELFDRRRIFSSRIALLLIRMIEEEHVPLIGKDGLKHRTNSLHYEGLAMDIDLFRNGVYLTKTEDHQPFGEYWESLHPLCCWGGRFEDGNHYAVTYGGRQ